MAWPRQSWTTAPTVTAVAYAAIMTGYYQPNLYHWDTNAQAAYLSLDQTGSANDRFISYDDAHACQAKVSYARNRGLGGVMIWELGQAYFPTQAPGQRDPLVQAVKQALAAPGTISILRVNTGIQLGFAAAPLALYRVLWTANPRSGTWTTLTNNVPGGASGIITQQIADPSPPAGQAQRFYRVQTPP